MAFLPTDLPTLKLWGKTAYSDAARTTVAAADASIAAVRDESASAFHLTQTSPANQPINKNGVFGLNPGWQFDGASHWLSNPTLGAQLTGDWSIGFIIKKAAASADAMVIMWGNAANGQRRAMWISSAGTLNFSGYAANLLSNGVVADNAAHHCVVARSGNNITIRVDGVEKAAGAVALSAYTSAVFAIGANNDGTEPFGGFLREIVVCSAALTGAGLADLEAYLNSKKNAPPPFAITTTSPLPGATVGVPYSVVIQTSNRAGIIFVDESVDFPPGIDTVSVNGDNVTISGTATGAGTFSPSLSLGDDNGYASKVFEITVVAAPVAAAPTSLWSKMNVVPLGALEAWNALDAATTGAAVADLSGKNRTLTAAANAPALQANVVNGYPGIYFDGTRDPLRFSGNTLFRHAFIVASFDGGTFTGNEGLFTDISTNPILVGGGAGSDKFLNLGQSQYGVYNYLKNYQPFPEAGQIAPVANKISIIEVIFPPSLFLNGIQFGQDRGLTGRKWKGFFIESLIYSEVKTEGERRQIYSYLAMKFHLWRVAANNLNIFPFPNNQKTTGQTFTNNLESVSISGAYKGRSKSGIIRNFDVPFTTRRQVEFDAAEAFWIENRSKCVLDDCSFYPSRQFTGRISTPIERDPQSINNFGYKFGFTTKAGSGGTFAQPIEGIDGGTV